MSDHPADWLHVVDAADSAADAWSESRCCDGCDGHSTGHPTFDDLIVSMRRMIAALNAVERDA